MRFVINTALTVVLVALGLWLTVSVVPGIDLVPDPSAPAVGGSQETTAFLAVALAFVILNLILGEILRTIAAPITCLTLGLFAFVINAVVLYATPWALEKLNLGLGTITIDGFVPAIIGGFILAIASEAGAMARNALSRKS